MNKIFILLLIISNFSLSAEHFNSLRELGCRIDAALVKPEISIEEVDSIAEGAAQFLARLNPPATVGQLQRFQERFEQLLNRVPLGSRQNRNVQEYIGWYERAADLRVSQLRPSMSMRAVSVVRGVSEQDAWNQVYADYLPIQRNNGSTVKSKATVIRTILSVLAGANNNRLKLLVGNRLSTQEHGLQVANAFLGFVLQDIESAADANAPQIFMARMRALEIYSESLGLDAMAETVRLQRDRITAGIQYRALVDRIQQNLDEMQARSLSRIPGRSRTGVCTRPPSEAGSRRARAEDRTVHSAPRNSAEVRPAVLLRDGTRIDVTVVDNVGAGDCLFYALGMTRAGFVEAVETSRQTNSNLQRAFLDGISANQPDYTSWYEDMIASENPRLGGEYEISLWHALTGTTVQIFDWRDGQWNFRTVYDRYENGQGPVRRIGYSGDGENGHWVELRGPGAHNENTPRLQTDGPVSMWRRLSFWPTSR